ncbi:ERF family protein [Fusobacterium nucleatum]|uniref:ERF family protein n=1 Tax=Fusobacterium nucleatum TaxID=851 RepID=UPI002361DB61|nr:ERF family protein [Fusobacterium nucleatum]WDD89083.1 ERF family protein [Fusobacterium nucleatum]
MNIYEKLLNVQTELKAPKGQFNAFGKYKYRSCEDILEALKPVLNKYKLTFFINDEIVEVNNRNYVKAIITIINIEKPDEQIQTSALAREEETKKGMDGSQITGASSSYARKYALNGMFMIDDTKDSDSTNTYGKDKTEQEKVKDFLNSRNGMIEKLSEYVKGDKLERMLKNYGVNELFEMKDEQLKDACKKIFDKKVS